MPKGFVPLPETTERLISRIIGGGLAVHRVFGPGFFEPVYRNAFCVELNCRGIRYEVEKPFVVTYRGQPVATQRFDLVVDNVVIVEIKAVDALAPIHEAQILSYMRATKIRAGLLMNFGGLTLREGLRRFVL